LNGFSVIGLAWFSKDRTGIFQKIGFALTVNNTKMLRPQSISNYFDT